ncbi:MAG: thermonuclease family protein [Planctomycetota bacterium]
MQNWHPKHLIATLCLLALAPWAEGRPEPTPPASAAPAVAQEDARREGLGRGLGALAADPEERLRQAAAADWHPGPPERRFEVVRVVDGDTIHIQRDGELQKLRLLSVDTEEKLSGRPNSGGSKPETVYGQASADWAVRFFADLADEDGTTRVGLLFPEGVERRDVYGRILCHVVLPDGTDFNLLLVALGRSPYFNKYGNSLICPEAFRGAQARARQAQLGVWDPATNAARDGRPEVKRPYAKLLPWWEARARAVEAFRAARSEAPDRVAAADEPEALEALLETEGDVRVFGSIFRIFEEDDRSVTLLFRTGETERAFRARVSARAAKGLDVDALQASTDEFRQNYLWVTGKLERDRKGFDIQVGDPDVVELAGPEPAALEAGPRSGGEK